MLSAAASKASSAVDVVEVSWAKLHLVRHQPVGQRPQFAVRGGCRCGIEHGSRAHAASGGKCRTRSSLRESRTARARRRARSPSPPPPPASLTPASFAPGSTTIRLVPSGSTQMTATPVLTASARSSQVVSIPSSARLASNHVAERIPPDAPDHDHSGAEASRHQRLIGTLAAEPDRERAADDGFARTRHRAAGSWSGRHCSSRQPRSSARGKSTRPRPRSLGEHAEFVALLDQP